MEEYKWHLHRLAVHDDALLGEIVVEGSRIRGARSSKRRPRRSCASARWSLVDAAPSSFQHAVALALAAGATSNEIVAGLEAVTPVTGAARVVQCAPKVALALGYDIDAALEQHDP